MTHRKVKYWNWRLAVIRNSELYGLSKDGVLLCLVKNT